MLVAITGHLIIISMVVRPVAQDDLPTVRRGPGTYSVGIMLIRPVAESRDSAIAAWHQPLDRYLKHHSLAS
jgi:hypothetical protein